jgi:Peptidase family S41
MKFLFTVVLSLAFIVSKGQTNNLYLTDLIELRKKIEQTPSFKSQIKGQKLIEYNNIYETLKSDSVYTNSDYKYFHNLSQLFFPIQDNHLGFFKIKNSTESIDSKFNGNIDSLKSILEKKSIDSVEGIYFYYNDYTIGLYKKSTSEYIGVVIDSKSKMWVKGQIIVRLYETLPYYFKAIYTDTKYNILTLYQIEKYSHHSLVNLDYSKVIRQVDHINISKSSSLFQFTNIASDIQYLRIENFSADPLKMKKSQYFFDSIKNLQTAQNLILDLRNNTGGADKVSKKFYKFIKKYTESGKVYILVNNRTISQGEILTSQLKKLNNVIILGQTTNGSLTYGSNYGKWEKLPSQNYSVYLTDMNDHKELLPYENYGIIPNKVLSENIDWIEQTIEIIRTK